MESICRLDAHRVQIINPNGVDVTLFANADVPVDRRSVAEIVSFTGIARTLDELGRVGFFGPRGARVARMVLTPDFHRGAGIPVGTVVDAQGFVLPRAIGRDIGCGMRLLATDVTLEEFRALGGALDRRLRAVFFEGDRGIPLSRAQREAIFRDGVQGLLACRHAGRGLWELWREDEQLADVMRTHALGRFATDELFGVDDFCRGSAASAGEFTYDDQIASIGGGNHFTEFQCVDEVLEGDSAWRWGLRRGCLTIMVHTGSVGIGHLVGAHFMELARSLHPGQLRHPEHGFHPLPLDGPHGEAGRRYLSAMASAANFAFANRLFLGLMALRALGDCLGRRVEARLVYDAPHNLAWPGGDGRVLHRKGACPAGQDAGDPEFPTGHPVIIPGSMGDASYVLRGEGAAASLCSACHGAGRVASRQTARHADHEELARLRVVTKVDPDSHAFRSRPDLVQEWRRTLLEEAPSAYKAITPVIDTVAGAGIAAPVCRLRPLLTVKG